MDTEEHKQIKNRRTTLLGWRGEGRYGRMGGSGRTGGTERGLAQWPLCKSKFGFYKTKSFEIVVDSCPKNLIENLRTIRTLSQRNKHIRMYVRNLTHTRFQPIGPQKKLCSSNAMWATSQRTRMLDIFDGTFDSLASRVRTKVPLLAEKEAQGQNLLSTRTRTAGPSTWHWK